MIPVREGRAALRDEVAHRFRFDLELTGPLSSDQRLKKEIARRHWDDLASAREQEFFVGVAELLKGTLVACLKPFCREVFHTGE